MAQPESRLHSGVDPSGNLRPIALDAQGRQLFMGASGGPAVSATLPSGSAITFTTGQTQNVLSISLPAGSWDVRGSVTWTCTTMPASTQITGEANLSATTGVLTDNGYQGYASVITGGSPSTFNFSCVVSPHRFTSGAAQTIYLVGKAPTFASGTVAAFGYIEATQVS
jgi:hypothetical protein